MGNELINFRLEKLTDGHLDFGVMLYENGCYRKMWECEVVSSLSE